MPQTRYRLNRACLWLVIPTIVVTTSCASAQSDPHVRFDRIVLSAEFLSEGAAFEDINGDGSTDIVSGPFWYAGPRFQQRHRYAVGGPYAIAGYSDFFFTFTADFDRDGDADILSIPMPGTAAWWHENPGGNTPSPWKRHLVLDAVGNESPTLTDLTGDGKPELVCINGQKWGFARPRDENPRAPWVFTEISDNRGLGRFTHGLGVGDLNADGRQDLLERTGWWEQPAQAKQPGAGGGEKFRFHRFPFAESGGSQMFAGDFDGDGDQDVVSVQNAHAWGLSWFERRGRGADVSFIPHEILPNKSNGDGQRFNLSQMHALAVADIDGDGVSDLVTGKRYYAHGGNDPGAHQLPLLCWFRTVRTPEGGVRFEPHLIDKQAGVGTQLTVADMNGDNRPDIVVGNKRGTVLFVNRGAAAGPGPQLTDADKAIGTTRFAQVIRESEPLTPRQELDTFVLPPGFTAELVAAEPQIAKPMNLAFDVRGRLWVSSSQEYPYAAPADREPADTIKILEDQDGDGTFETVTTFADKLNVPIGLYPYKDGVICFSVPNIWFLRDTDNDGRADVREKLYGPMGYERDTHGMCNAFTRGFDGWLYACHGFNNNTTVAGRDGHEITMQSGNIFRMRTDGLRVEHFTHGLVNPFGMTFDSSGDQFVADCHTKPISLLLRGGYYDSFGKPHDGLGYVPSVMNHLHGSTAIGGIAQASPGSFPGVYDGNTFGGNVMTGRINRNSLHHTGSTVRAQEEPDFLVSGDPWFRPVDLQFGPDGALYVADFYNRIIGHYEVKLDHPGRDRLRGRVWRIRYTGTEERRDPGAGSQSADRLPDLSNLTPTQLVGRFRSPNLAERQLAADRLVDHFGLQGLDALRVGSTFQHPSQRIHSLWALNRLGALSAEQVLEATKHRDPLVRVHAQRIAEALPESPAHLVDIITGGLADDSARVQRAAAIAATVHRHRKLLPRLLDTLRKTPQNDVHLRHALRMAIRDHLTNKEWFEETVASVEQLDVPVLAGICLALRSEHAGEFLASVLDRLPSEDPKEFAEYLKFAAQYVSPASVDVLVRSATSRFEDNSSLQLELLRSVDSGLRQRGAERPPSVTDWATRLASSLLDLDKTGRAAEPLNWSFIPLPGSQTKKNPWSVSRRRTSADGRQNTPLFSSFPAGESKTGIYRSDAFALPAQFRFFMAGHDGYPDKGPQGKNLVRLRDALTHRTLQSWQPPRNDTAQPFSWDAADAAGRSVYVELIDADSAGAFAWIAVGRFSEPRLNPGRSRENRRQALALCRDLQLTNMRHPLVGLLEDPGTSRSTANEAALAIASFSQDSRLTAIANAMQLSLPPALRAGCIDAIVNSDFRAARIVLPQAMQAAPAAAQFAVANVLASDLGGAAVLTEMFESGKLSSMLLRRPGLATKLAALSDTTLRTRLIALTKDLPSEDVELNVAIERTIRGYLNEPGNRAAGKPLFTKHCGICHQVAGEGKKIGPNLDGIGTRGLHRLVEDLLAPNRNVDVNFVATTIVTDDGQVHSGLLQPDTGAQTVLINSEGKEVAVPTETVEDQKTSRLSPMPGNLRDKLKAAELRDLLAYLLSL